MKDLNPQSRPVSLTSEQLKASRLGLLGRFPPPDLYLPEGDLGVDESACITTTQSKMDDELPSGPFDRGSMP